MEFIDCFDGYDEVCIKEYLVCYKEFIGDEYEEFFFRICGMVDLCINKNCEKYGVWCDFKCCYEDLCNIVSMELLI